MDDQLRQLNERFFDPLLISLTLEFIKNPTFNRDDVIDNYMFMHRSSNQYAYKHVWTREYVCIDEIGNVVRGKLNLNAYAYPSSLTKEEDVG
ncbi:hypothetical protein [Paenibacillus sp. GXUN7292]|uniref:hypothetical protein n=1 Tax=Paenibacillus sp. GXUN7292 TaxID=3422499 RepID=UPI003D7E5A8E